MVEVQLLSLLPMVDGGVYSGRIFTDLFIISGVWKVAEKEYKNCETGWLLLISNEKRKS